MAGTAAGQLLPVEDKQLMPPPPPRPAKRKVVLEEAAYTDAIEAIIERDFFPDVPKLQNQLDWLQAIQSGDPAKISQAQLAIARRRAGLDPHAAAAAAAPTASMLPGLSGTALRTPAMTPLGFDTPAQQAAAAATTAAAALAADAPRAPALSLDAFCSQYTSEDNASFAQLQEQTLARKRARAAHHLEDKNQQLLLTGPSATDEYGTSGQQPGTLVDVKHVPRNTLYYDSSQQPTLELSAAEQLAIVKGAPKAVAHAATRLDEGDANDDPAAAVQQLAADAVAADAEAAAAASAAAHGTKGYAYMRTPNLAPGVGASPLMTWGTIASTPLRLEVDAALQAAMTPSIPVDATPGPQFKLPEQREREVAAMQYINKRQATAAAARRHKGSTPLLDALRRRHGTPGSTAAGGGGAATPLSAAGKKLANRLKGGRTPSGLGAAAGAADGLDSQLRASYSGTPARHSVTPSGMRSSSGLPPQSHQRKQQHPQRAAPAAAAAEQKQQQQLIKGRAAEAAAHLRQQQEGAAAAGMDGGSITDGLLRLG